MHSRTRGICLNITVAISQTKKPLPRSKRGFAVCIYAQRLTAQAILFKWSIRLCRSRIAPRPVSMQETMARRLACPCIAHGDKPTAWRTRRIPPKTISWVFAHDAQAVSGAFVVFRLPHVVWKYLVNLKAQPPRLGPLVDFPQLGSLVDCPYLGPLVDCPPRGAPE